MKRKSWGWEEGEYDFRQYLKAWGVNILAILFAILYFGLLTQTVEDRVLCVEHGKSPKECRREEWETGFFIVSLIAIGIAGNKAAKDFSRKEASWSNRKISKVKKK